MIRLVWGAVVVKHPINTKVQHCYRVRLCVHQICPHQESNLHQAAHHIYIKDRKIKPCKPLHVFDSYYLCRGEMLNSANL